MLGESAVVLGGLLNLHTYVGSPGEFPIQRCISSVRTTGNLTSFKKHVKSIRYSLLFRLCLELVYDARKPLLTAGGQEIVGWEDGEGLLIDQVKSIDARNILTHAGRFRET